jgi:hypothetical protein
VDKIIIEQHRSKIDKDGRRHYLIRAIPYQNPQQEAERLKTARGSGSRSSPGSEQRRRANRSSGRSFDLSFTHGLPDIRPRTRFHRSPRHFDSRISGARTVACKQAGAPCAVGTASLFKSGAMAYAGLPFVP